MRRAETVEHPGEDRCDLRRGRFLCLLELRADVGDGLGWRLLGERVSRCAALVLEWRSSDSIDAGSESSTPRLGGRGSSIWPRRFWRLERLRGGLG